jgi:hypothetical protein
VALRARVPASAPTSLTPDDAAAVRAELSTTLGLAVLSVSLVVAEATSPTTNGSRRLVVRTPCGRCARMSVLCLSASLSVCLPACLLACMRRCSPLRVQRWPYLTLVPFACVEGCCVEGCCVDRVVWRCVHRTMLLRRCCLSSWDQSSDRPPQSPCT